MSGKFTKTIALTLTALTLSLPLSQQALAAPPKDGPKPPPKVEQRHDSHPQVKKPAPPPRHEVKNPPPPRHEVKKPAPPPKHEVKKPAPPPKHEVKKPTPPPHRVHPPRPAPRRHHPAPPPPRRDRESHSDVGNLITGGIIGLVLGAIIASNA